TMPTSRRSWSMTGSRRTFAAAMIFDASSTVWSTTQCTTSSLTASLTGVAFGSAPSATQRITMSRSVTIPMSFASSTTGNEPTSASRIFLAASARLWLGEITSSLDVITSLTSIAFSSIRRRMRVLLQLECQRITPLVAGSCDAARFCKSRHSARIALRYPRRPAATTRTAVAARHLNQVTPKSRIGYEAVIVWQFSRTRRRPMMENPRHSARHVDEHRSKPPFFVVGSGRSGTTLLQALIDAHPNLSIPPESHLYDRIAPVFDTYGDLSIQSNRLRFIADLLADAYIRQWRLDATPDEIEARVIRGDRVGVIDA